MVDADNHATSHWIVDISVPQCLSSFPHDLVECEQRCNLRMLCGHVCDKPCSENHDCFCKCELSSSMLSEVEPANVAGSSIDHRPKVSTEEELKKQAIRGYQEFAQWGAKQQDILLLRRANPRSLAMMQRENHNAILTSDSSSTRHRKGKKKASAVSAKKDGIPRAAQEGTLLDD
jgi:helicase required for RNAi-mediated heterochromatin assembly 1